MMSEVLLIIVGCEKDERAIPFIIGGFNFEFMAQLPQEDTEKQIKTLKETWTGEPSMYDWREVKLRLDTEELKNLFGTPEVEGYWEE